MVSAGRQTLQITIPWGTQNATEVHQKDLLEA